MELPLFPLRTVLFPGMPLPLQIFEERYKTMTRELLASRGRFGVLLIREGNEVGGGAVPYSVGTTAFIEEWRELENGRFQLTARGEQRFRLVEMLPPRPYPYGAVELLDDTSFAPDPETGRLLVSIRARFPEYLQLALSLSGQWARPMRLPSAPHELVDFLAPWLQADEMTKQKLLEPVDAVDRLRLLSALIEQLLRRTRREVAERRRQRFGGPGATN
jgi:Lon protease-like protein